MNLTLKDGRTVEVRPMQADEDVFELTRYINDLIDEGVRINMVDKVTPEEEAAWLEGHIQDIERGDLVHWVVLDSGKIVGGAEARCGRWREKDIVSFGIALSSGYRGHGLGTRILRALVDEAKKKWKPRKMVIDYYSGNEGARRCYEAVGFKEIARVPGWYMYKGAEEDKVIMELVE